jgi:hypothetical protein
MSLPACLNNTPVLTAKMLSNQSNRKVLYAFSDNSEICFLDKKDMILNQIEACEKLLKFIMDYGDRKTVENEIEELKTSLDFLD